MGTINLTAVVRQTGINAHTLRAWERRYQVVTPLRDKTGRRAYTEKDVERLHLIKALVSEGHLIGQIASRPTPVLKKMLKGTLSPAAPTLTAHNDVTEKLLRSITGSLEVFDLEKLNHHLQRARYDLTTKEIVINLVRPLLGRVGKMVADEKLSLTQEHLLSSLLRDFLGNIHLSLAPYDLSHRRHSPAIVLTTREGDFHDFGIFLAAILANLYRYRIYYLCPSTPVPDLVELCKQVKANYLLAGFTYLPSLREVITPEAVLAQVDRGLPREVSLLVGGVVSMEGIGKKTDRVTKHMGDLHELDRFLAEHA